MEDKPEKQPWYYWPWRCSRLVFALVAVPLVVAAVSIIAYNLAIILFAGP